MSRKYNTVHPERTRKAPRSFKHLEDVDTLRRRQLRRVEETGVPFPAYEDEEREAA